MRQPTSGRTAILRTIAGALGPKRPPLPLPPVATGRLPQEGDAVARFRAKAEGVAATTEVIGSMADLPGAVQRLLAAGNLPSRLAASPAPEFQALDWPATLDVRFGRSDGTDLVGLSWAAAGIAETGTLLLWSDATSPTTLNFLPDHHVVVVPLERIVADLDQAIARVPRDALPRTLNFVTGPSRTGDIEQMMVMGAHGPRRLHIVIVDGTAASEAPVAAPADGA
ncbi:LutC/YkgG family protein [Zavarzinia sp. CC-PAN008]|uniref:LutC/YkgG family protein n=1 Tax=Zavarzinia sp. CC-PAN008 TaxID=3243332 RepID=UPI003F744771